MRKIISLSSIAIFLIIDVMANTYFVSGTGDNSNAGTEASPWATLQYAVDNVEAGDSIVLMTGFHAGCYMETSGTRQNPIVICARSGAVLRSKNSTTNDGINLEGASYVIIDGLTFMNDGSITRAGIRSVVNEGVIIRNNWIDNMGCWGIFTGFSENIIIENNSCSNSNDEHGIYFSNSADNPIIRYNTCFGNNGCGIHMNGDESMGGDGIISNALVEGNIIFDNGAGGGSGINGDGVQNSIIQNNLIYSNHASGISLYKIDGAEGGKNNIVVNNTIIMADDGRWAINIGDNSTGNTIYNNILFNNQSYRGAISCNEESLAGLVSDYNIVIDRFTTDDGDTRLTLAEWQAETGQDAHSIVSTSSAIFVNSGETPYALKEGSTAIDFGTNTHAPSTDILHATRPAGVGIDAGAYEYNGVVPANDALIDEYLFRIFPNPVNSNFSIEAATVISSVEIIDINGKIMQQLKGVGSKSITVFCEEYDCGLFICKVHFKDGNYGRVQFIIQ